MEEKEIRHQNVIDVAEGEEIGEYIKYRTRGCSDNNRYEYAQIIADELRSFGTNSKPKQNTWSLMMSLPKFEM